MQAQALCSTTVLHPSQMVDFDRKNLAKNSSFQTQTSQYFGHRISVGHDQQNQSLPPADPGFPLPL